MGATEAAGDSKAAEGETVTERERERTQRERFKLFLLRGDYPFRYSTYIALILCSLTTVEFLTAFLSFLRFAVYTVLSFRYQRTVCFWFWLWFVVCCVQKTTSI